MTEIKNLGPSIYDVHTGEGVKKSLFPYGRHCGWGFQKVIFGRHKWMATWHSNNIGGDIFQ